MSRSPSQGNLNVSGREATKFRKKTHIDWTSNPYQENENIKLYQTDHFLWDCFWDEPSRSFSFKDNCQVPMIFSKCRVMCKARARFSGFFVLLGKEEKGILKELWVWLRLLGYFFKHTNIFFETSYTICTCIRRYQIRCITQYDSTTKQSVSLCCLKSWRDWSRGSKEPCFFGLHFFVHVSFSCGVGWYLISISLIRLNTFSQHEEMTRSER